MSTIYTVNGRRVAIHDREEWQSSSQPVTGPNPYPDLVDYLVIHWPGAADNWNPPLDTAQHLREGQADYLKNKGYSYGYGFVIGYNHIDWNADPIVFDCWEVRGFDIRVASNNGDVPPYSDYEDPNFNGHSCSVQIMSSTNYPATADQIEQAQYMAAIADDYYNQVLTLIPHRESDQTSCPGDYLTSMVATIAQRPGTHPPEPPTNPPNTGGDFMATLPTIKKGDKGDYVERMQHLLSAAGYLSVTAANFDGVWGSGTDAAKLNFDKAYGLYSSSHPTDTSCGPKSWESLMTGKHW